ncbi:TANK-binding kinase 1-binding protein 1-like [Acipenser ruthenus]|uniref:TANK-binding kinase 1-binding protein 1-like n=1 Tax=Acipenser ruthenus TaxID=7906 RepID=UPI0027409A5C|nr:TANK-binding kinase 1-binding protein 1-like [Acipenser ruthenus]XP_058859260.1 TANK-binding kinase 1-binding protein 1-like [Acipenser ruthenus]
MDSLFGGELGILTAEGLTEEGCGVGWASRPLPGNMYSAPHFALITAYQDIKNRLSGLERENCGLKRRLKLYEIKFPMISDFSNDRNSYCSFETKETSMLNNSLQQQLNQLQHELQNGKEREEHLEAVIQAYEKIHMERSNLQRDLDQMTTLAEKHVEHIRNLEQMLRQRDSSLQNLNSQLHSKEMQYLQLHTSPVHPRMLACPAMALQSSRSLDALSDLELQRLEAELEEARREAGEASQREAELKGECERLREELRQQEEGREQGETTAQCDQCDVEWIKKAGDEQVNLALAYTELTEELSRLQSLSSKQTEILRSLSQEQSQPVQRHSPVPQRHSPAPQRRSPVPQRLSPDVHRRSPLPDSNDGPASYTGRPTSHHLRASFQGRRSYSEVSDPAAYQRPPRLQLDPVSTLPKPRPYREGYQKQGQGLSSSVTSSPRHTRDPFTPQELLHLRFDKTARPPQQSSEDDEEWAAATPPGSLGAGSIRGEASCSAFPIPKTFPPPSSALRCPPLGYQHTEHAQSWPSINLWMETEDCDIRSCPLCQLSFPIGYPDDALIKHIDTHLENSKI